MPRPKPRGAKDIASEEDADVGMARFNDSLKIVLSVSKQELNRRMKNWDGERKKLRKAQ